MPHLLVPAYSIVVFAMLVLGARSSQSVLAFSCNILDANSCLALPASAKARGDAGSGMCIIEGSLALDARFAHYMAESDAVNRLQKRSMSVPSVPSGLPASY